jgi:hypothetical protein
MNKDVIILLYCLFDFAFLPFLHPSTSFPWFFVSCFCAFFLSFYPFLRLSFFFISFFLHSFSYLFFLISAAGLISLSFSRHLSRLPFLKSSLCNVHLCVRFEVVTMVNMSDDNLVFLRLSPWWIWAMITWCSCIWANCLLMKQKASICTW